MSAGDAAVANASGLAPFVNFGLSVAGAQVSNARQYKYTRKARLREYQDMMSSMKAAGLNPMLAAGASPGHSAISAQPISASGPDAVGGAVNTAKSLEERRRTREETKLTRNQAHAADFQARSLSQGIAESEERTRTEIQKQLDSREQRRLMIAQEQTEIAKQMQLISSSGALDASAKETRLRALAQEMDLNRAQLESDFWQSDLGRAKFMLDQGVESGAKIWDMIRGGVSSAKDLDQLRHDTEQEHTETDYQYDEQGNHKGGRTKERTTKTIRRRRR